MPRCFISEDVSFDHLVRVVSASASIVRALNLGNEEESCRGRHLRLSCSYCSSLFFHLLILTSITVVFAKW